MSKTPWFNVTTQNPVRVGVYEVKGWWGIMYSKWDGHRWFSVDCIQYYALMSNTISKGMLDPGTKWRGLTKEQK